MNITIKFNETKDQPIPVNVPILFVHDNRIRTGTIYRGDLRWICCHTVLPDQQGISYVNPTVVELWAPIGVEL